MFKLMNKKMKNKKGFTLIELIVVIAIIGILAAIAIPRIGGFTETAKQTSDEAIANNLASAGAMYYAKNAAAPASVTVLYADKLTSFVDDADVKADIKSAKYAPVAATAIAFAAGADGRITVTIDGATDLIATK